MTARLPEKYRSGSTGYRAITAALFAAGMATFVSMYAAQAVLPQISEQFDVTPASASLVVSMTTGLLAFAIIPASILSERFGRIRIMAASALLTAVIGLLIPLATSLELVLVGRALQGITCAGVPAVAMAYLAEEVDSASLGAAMGRYIAGTTIGGLAGRVIASLGLDVGGWRWGLEAAMVVALVFTVIFIRLAPPSHHFEPQRIGLAVSIRNVVFHLRNRRVMALVSIAFLLMGSFVSVYNLLSYRLLAPPFRLPEYVVGLIFIMYLSGTVSSAWAGSLADRYGRPVVLIGAISVMASGLIVTLSDNIWVVLIGVLLFTGGFFGAHSTASGWVSANATQHRAEASSLYLFGYYVGSSVVGALAGIPFAHWAWGGTVAVLAALIALALLLALWLSRSARAARLS